MTTDTKELRNMPVVTVEQVGRFRDAALAANDTLALQLTTLREALTKANEDINWMLNAREFLSAFVFDYIEKALAATAPAAREGEA